VSALADRTARWWDSLATRERMVVAAGAVIAAAILLIGGTWALAQRVDAARERLSRKQRDLVFVQLASAEILAAGPARPAGAGDEPLLVLADRLARESGLRESLTGTESSADGSLRTTFRAVSFDMLTGMLFRLTQQHGVAVREARIEDADAPGRVDATILLGVPPASR
jgi:type II secretory pathway component PulM